MICGGYPRGRPEVAVDGIQILRVGGKYSVYPAVFKTYLQKLAPRNFDVLFECINSVPFFCRAYSRLPLVALIFQLGKGVYFLEDSVLVGFAGLASEAILCRAYRTEHVVTIGDVSKRELNALGMKKVAVINPGLDESFHQLVDNTEDVPRSPTRILYVGRLKKYKGIDLLIAAVRRLSQRWKDVELVVAGKGDFEPGLRALASHLGVSDRVTFLGYVSEEEKVSLMKSSRVFAYPSMREGGWSISCAEAMRCGMPVVASEQVADTVKHGVTGLVTPFGDAASLTQSIATLLADGNMWNRMSQNAADWASKLTWEATATETLHVLRASCDG
jgi:glycosyltransferase involved in cell wall biosynthesis